jgi:hypothetical protein
MRFFVTRHKGKHHHDPSRHSGRAGIERRSKVPVPGGQRVTEGRVRLRRPVAQHPHVPCLAGKLISFLAGFRRALRFRPDRTAVDVFSRLGGHGGKNAPSCSGSASRYGLRVLMAPTHEALQVALAAVATDRARARCGGDRWGNVCGNLSGNGMLQHRHEI